MNTHDCMDLAFHAIFYCVIIGFIVHLFNPLKKDK